VQSPVGPFDRLFVAAGQQIGKPEAAIGPPADRIEWAQSNRPLQRVDRRPRPVRKAVEKAAKHPCDRGVRAKGERSLDRVQAGDVLESHCREHPATHPQRVRIVLARVDCRSRQADGLGDIGIGNRTPAPQSLLLAAETDHRGRRRVRRIDSNRVIRQCDSLGRSRCSVLRNFRTRSKVEVIGIEARGRLAAGALHFGCAHGRLDDTGDAGCDLVLQVEHVFQ